MNLYEELLPLWKARCKGIRGSESPNTGIHSVHIWGWYRELQQRGLHCTYRLGADGQHKDCIVNGVMHFSWEQGLEE